MLTSTRHGVNSDSVSWSTPLGVKPVGQGIQHGTADNINCTPVCAQHYAKKCTCSQTINLLRRKGVMVPERARGMTEAGQSRGWRAGRWEGRLFK